MRIGIDGRSLKTNRAIFRYTKNLLNSLSAIDKENEYFLLMEGDQALNEIKYLNLSLNWHLVKASRKIVLKDHLIFKNFIDAHNFDVFFHPDNTEFLRCHPRSVVTVHDLIPHLLPELSLEVNGPRRWLQNLYLSLQKKSLVESAAHIIAVSENTKRDLINLFGIFQSKVTVIHEAVEPSFRPAGDEAVSSVKKEYGLSGEYLFCHTGFSPYKNIWLLIQAFDIFCRNNEGVRLVLGGSHQEKDRYYRRVISEVGRLGLDDKIVFAGFIPEDKLPALYGGARMFIYPSLYEGFGLPVLEAQACGVPVMLSTAASLPEVGGEGAVYFDPDDASLLSEKMTDLYRNEESRQKMVNLGFENIKRFSWEKCARQTLEVFNNLVKSGNE